MKFAILILLVIFLCSCSEYAVESKLINNSWSVEEVEFQDSTYGLFFFRYNSIKFMEDNKCRLPYFESLQNNSRWAISNVSSFNFDLILENSEDKFLDGTYRSKIYYDPSSKLQTLSLENEQLKLICRSSL